MDIIALEEKCLIGLDYQYVGGANVLVLSPVSPAILGWPQHAQLATGGTYQQQAYAFSFSFLWFNSKIIFNV